MERYHDQKGMTLIEVVVVLFISAIVMTMVGSMILSSMGYFSEEVVMDQDKQGLDDIASYVRKQLLYATDIKVTKDKPSDKPWQCLYVKDGVLYANDKALLSKQYYQGRMISIQVQGFDQYCLDLDFTYLNTNKNTVYQTKTSVEMMNVKIAVEKDHSYKPLDNIRTALTIDEEHKIYYIKDPKRIDDGPIDNKEGTVEEQLRCLNNGNHRGEFIIGMYYYKGDIAFYDGNYWMNVQDSGVFGEYPDCGRRWKKLDAFFDENSAYEIGDVVLFYKDSKRYMAKQSMLTWTPTPDSWNGSEGGYWQLVSDDTKDEGVCKGLIGEQQIMTVRNKLDNIDETKIVVYDNTHHYDVGNVVYIMNETTGIKEFYLKVFQGEGKPGSHPSSGWQHLTRDYDSNSAYVTGDVVAYLQGEIGYLEFLQTIDQTLDITSEINQTWPGPSTYVREYSKE